MPLEKSRASSSEKSGAHHTYTRSPLRDNKSENMAIDTDDDDDELDLIGSSAHSDEGKREARQGASKVMRRSGLPAAKIEASMSIDNLPLSTPESSKKIVAPQNEVLTTEMDVDKDPPKRQEPRKDKEDAIDAEEVEAITKPSDAEVAGHSSTAEDKMDISAASVTTAVVSDNAPSQQAQASPLPSSQTPPVVVQQTTPVPVPSPDDKLPQLSASEPVTLKAGPASPIDNYRFNPTYPIPPLAVLPADFTKKAKSIKRKKDRDREKERESKRDKDDVPMGLSRWAATLMANPVWRKVSRANKTLSTHDWSVRIRIYASTLLLKYVYQVAMTELRLIRTIERIELLKNDGRWSFRQPKKQRGIGGSVKSHWDYLLDEMVGLHPSNHNYILIDVRNG